VIVSIRYATSEASPGAEDPIAPVAFGETVATNSMFFDMYLYITS
jgi:hypothetical protein